MPTMVYLISVTIETLTTKQYRDLMNQIAPGAMDHLRHPIQIGRKKPLGPVLYKATSSPFKVAQRSLVI